MKTITIPEYKNPFVVVINNSVYQYKGGETIEVPDDVAEAIEDAIELIPKPKRYLSLFAKRVEGSITELSASDFEGIESIGDYAFLNCKPLTLVELPNSITSIGVSAFSGCSSLKNITIGSRVTSIGNYAFYGCTSLASIEITNSVTSIGSEVFYGCTSLEAVRIPEVPPALANVNAFPDDIKDNCVFYCKSQASLDAYKAAPNWSTLTGTYSFVVEE